MKHLKKPHQSKQSAKRVIGSPLTLERPLVAMTCSCLITGEAAAGETEKE